MIILAIGYFIACLYSFYICWGLFEHGDGRFIMVGMIVFSGGSGILVLPPFLIAGYFINKY